jgi:hypothetical protein
MGTEPFAALIKFPTGISTLLLKRLSVVLKERPLRRQMLYQDSYTPPCTSSVFQYLSCS